MAKRDVTYTLVMVDKATKAERFVSNYPRYILAAADGRELERRNIREHWRVSRSQHPALSAPRA